MPVINNQIGDHSTSYKLACLARHLLSDYKTKQAIEGFLARAAKKGVDQQPIRDALNAELAARREAQQQRAA